MNFFDALTLVFAIYAFIAALLLYIAQTENYNRVSHYWMKKRDRAWVVLFNTSRRHLVNKAFFEPLSFKCEGLTLEGNVKHIGKVGKEDELKLSKVGGKYVLDFDYLAPKAAVIAEFKADANVVRPEIEGVLKGGRLVKCHFQFDDFQHHTPIVVLGYLVFCVLVIGGLLYLRSVTGMSHEAFWVYAVATVILAAGVFWFFTQHRRIFVGPYMKVRKEMWKKRNPSFPQV